MLCKRSNKVQIIEEVRQLLIALVYLQAFLASFGKIEPAEGKKLKQVILLMQIAPLKRQEFLIELIEDYEY